MRYYATKKGPPSTDTGLRPRSNISISETNISIRTDNPNSKVCCAQLKIALFPYNIGTYAIGRAHGASTAATARSHFMVGRRIEVVNL